MIVLIMKGCDLMFKSLLSKIKMATKIVKDCVSVIKAKIVALFPESKKEESVEEIIVITEDSDVETSVVSDDAIIVMTTVITVVALTAVSFIVVANFPLTILFLMEIAAVYKVLDYALASIVTTTVEA